MGNDKCCNPVGYNVVLYNIYTSPMTQTDETADKKTFLHMPIDPILKEKAEKLSKKKGLKSTAALVRYLLAREIEKDEEREENAKKPPQ